MAYISPIILFTGWRRAKWGGIDTTSLKQYHFNRTWSQLLPPFSFPHSYFFCCCRCCLADTAAMLDAIILLLYCCCCCSSIAQAFQHFCEFCEKGAKEFHSFLLLFLFQRQCRMPPCWLYILCSSCRGGYFLLLLFWRADWQAWVAGKYKGGEVVVVVAK